MTHPPPSQLELEYQAILQNAGVGILFTRNRRFEHCNPRAAEIFGWTPDALVGQPGSVLYFSEADYTDIGRLASPLLAAGQLFEQERLMRRRDGSAVFCQLRAKSINPHDSADGTIWIVEDISERKRAEQELRLLLLHQQAILDNASVGILFTCNGLIQHCNPRFEELLGYERGQLLGQSAQVFFKSADDYQRFGAAIGDDLAAGQRIEIEWRNRRIDDSLVWMRIMARALPQPGDEKITIWITEDIEQRKATEAQLAAAYAELQQRAAYLTFHDALTGLPNRQLLQERFSLAIAHADRECQRVALLYLDLDNFKHINDTLGHACGDALLQQVAQQLQQCLRQTDTLSRQGGDEFIALLTDLKDNQAAAPVLAKLMANLEQPFVLDGHELALTCSIGVALYPDDGRDFDTLLRKADMALYRAKDLGRNSHHYFNEDMGQQAGEHLRLRAGLRRALEYGELLLHYQPQFDLRSGALVGAEALLRWQHPEQGLIAPARFIPVAEESGLIVPIGAWVLEEVCRQGRAWLDAGLPPLLLAVNLSAVQFKRGDLEATVQQALARSGLPAHLLELELTESLLLHNTDAMLALVRRLKLMGAKLSIDDFGTGYSSLSYLKRFEVDKLKIDQSFVRDLLTDPDDAAIVRAIVQMAAGLGLRTLAEGVESAAVAERIAQFGCDEAQGYHYARPMTAPAFKEFLQRYAATAGLKGNGFARHPFSVTATDSPKKPLDHGH